jgi:hypothetical protein
LGHELTENNVIENREFGHTARSATSRFSFAGSSFGSAKRYACHLALPISAPGFMNNNTSIKNPAPPGTSTLMWIQLNHSY